MCIVFNIYIYYIRIQYILYYTQLGYTAFESVVTENRNCIMLYYYYLVVVPLCCSMCRCVRRHQRGKTRVLDDGSSGGRKPQYIDLPPTQLLK